MRFKHPFGNHNGGLIAFNPTAPRGDPDYGNLYLAMGDGGASGDPQENGEDPSNPYGAILRIDPTGNDSANGKYGIVQANRFARDNNANTLAEIYCYGLRNPQRFGWDAVTGNCFIADIGQNAIEEIDLAANGAHFGWDIREGSFAFEGSDNPRFTDRSPSTTTRIRSLKCQLPSTTARSRLGRLRAEPVSSASTGCSHSPIFQPA